jgi:hypothetical protein
LCREGGEEAEVLPEVKDKIQFKEEGKVGADHPEIPAMTHLT